MRAILAGRPFVWQLYPQEDGAHLAKLEAFLGWLSAPADWQAFHRAWNAPERTPLPPLAPANVDDWVGGAEARSPSIQQAQLNLDVAKLETEKARAGHLPTVTLGASYGRTYPNGSSDTSSGGLLVSSTRPGNSNSGALALTVNVPLFAGFATTYKVQAAKAQLEARQAQAEQLRVQVAQDVWNAAQALVTATESARTTVDLLASAEQSDKVARGRYESGVGTLLEMLNAQSALAAARQQRVQALYDWNVARAALARAVGDLGPSFIDTLTIGEAK